VAYRIVVASLVVCLLLVVGMLLERTGFIEIGQNRTLVPEET
jgi:preprotein translocase subunit SecG